MIRGSCLCGAVRWEIHGPVEHMRHCHCGNCRKAHGAAFATSIFASQDDYRLITGAEVIRQYPSSPSFSRGFCGTCGSAMPIDLDGHRVAIPAGCLDDDPGIRPEMHIFVASKARWNLITDDLPRHNRYPTERSFRKIESPAEGGTTPGILHGSCLCGGIAYEVTTPFTVVHNCHCSRCRKSRSAAHTTNGFTPIDGVRFIKGEDLLVSYKLPEAKTYTPTFCRVCGSGMPRLRVETGTAIVPLGSLDNDPGRIADDHIFTGSKAPWYEITDDLPQFEEMPT